MSVNKSGFCLFTVTCTDWMSMKPLGNSIEYSPKFLILSVLSENSTEMSSCVKFEVQR